MIQYVCENVNYMQISDTSDSRVAVPGEIAHKIVTHSLFLPLNPSPDIYSRRSSALFFHSRSTTAPNQILISPLLMCWPCFSVDCGDFNMLRAIHGLDWRVETKFTGSVVK